MLRKIFASKTDKLTEYWRKMHNRYSSFNTIRVIK
jgi:hypothetical protein